MNILIASTHTHYRLIQEWISNSSDIKVNRSMEECSTGNNVQVMMINDCMYRELLPSSQGKRHE